MRSFVSQSLQAMDFGHQSLNQPVARCSRLVCPKDRSNGGGISPETREALWAQCEVDVARFWPVIVALPPLLWLMDERNPNRQYYYLFECTTQVATRVAGAQHSCWKMVHTILYNKDRVSIIRSNQILTVN